MVRRLHPGFLLVVHTQSKTRRVLNIVELLTCVTCALHTVEGSEGHTLALSVLGEGQIQVVQSRTDIKQPMEF